MILHLQSCCVESDLLLVLMKTMLYMSLEWYHLTALTIPVKHYIVYRLNADVDERKEHMLSMLDSATGRHEVKASDAVTGQTKRIDLASLSGKRKETGGLHGILKIACGARVMLTTNVDVLDGLANGARGHPLFTKYKS